MSQYLIEGGNLLETSYLPIPSVPSGAMISGTAVVVDGYVQAAVDNETFYWLAGECLWPRDLIQAEECLMGFDRRNPRG